MRTGYFLILMLWAAAAPAQTMYKCVDDQQKVTYSNISCAKQGLKDAGTVTTDRVTTLPSQGPTQLPTQKLRPPIEMPKGDDKNAK
jgi:Domain of unknown function (DUF4124)